MQRHIIRRDAGNGVPVPTTTNPEDEIQLDKVGGYAYIDASHDTLDEDLSQINAAYTGEIVVPVTNYPNRPFILGKLDPDATHVFEKGKWDITLKHRSGQRYAICPEHTNSRETVIKRIS